MNMTTDFVNRRLIFAEAMASGIAIIPTAKEAVRNRDAHFPYRFDSYFYYLTGFMEPESVVVITGGASSRSILFCRAKNEEKEKKGRFMHVFQIRRANKTNNSTYPNLGSRAVRATRVSLATAPRRPP